MHYLAFSYKIVNHICALREFIHNKVLLCTYVTNYKIGAKYYDVADPYDAVKKKESTMMLHI